MEHDFLINGSYSVAVLQILLCTALMLQGILRKHNLLGRLEQLMLRYFYSFSPVGMLIYLLYVVNHMK